MDPAVIAFFTERPSAMDDLDDLAGRLGQDLSLAMAPTGHPEFEGCVVVGYTATKDPIGIFRPDGTFESVMDL